MVLRNLVTYAFAGLAAIGCYLAGTVLGPGSVPDRVVGLIFFWPVVLGGWTVIAMALSVLGPFRGVRASRLRQAGLVILGALIGLAPGGLLSLGLSFSAFWLAARAFGSSEAIQ